MSCILARFKYSNIAAITDMCIHHRRSSRHLRCQQLYLDETMDLPVMYLLASDASRTITPFKSDGSANRPMGIRFTHSSFRTGLLSRMTLVKLVRVYPGLRVSTHYARRHSCLREAVDPDVLFGPFDSEGPRHMPDCGLCTDQHPVLVLVEATYSKNCRESGVEAH